MNKHNLAEQFRSQVRKLGDQFAKELESLADEYAVELRDSAVKEMIQRLAGGPVINQPSRLARSVVNGAPPSRSVEKRLAAQRGDHPSRLKSSEASQEPTPALILDSIDAGYVNCAHISKAIGLGYYKTFEMMQQMKRQGLITMKGERRGSRWSRVQPKEKASE